MDRNLERIEDFVSELLDYPRLLNGTTRRITSPSSPGPFVRTRDRADTTTNRRSHGTDGATIGNLFCPSCGGYRRVNATTVSTPGTFAWRQPSGQALLPPEDETPFETIPERPNEPTDVAAKLVPSLYILSCVQCDAEFTAVIHAGAAGPGLVILPSIVGGLRTPNTPDSVAFYLDQAQRCRSVGAFTAAGAMYRAALDQLLTDQGYTNGMCGQKLGALDTAILAKTAPQWALDLDTEFLDVLKQLGDGAIHPGDIRNQAVLDPEFLASVTETFLFVLTLVYETEQKKSQLKSHLHAKAAILKKK